MDNERRSLPEIAKGLSDTYFTEAVVYDAISRYGMNKLFIDFLAICNNEMKILIEELSEYDI